MPELNEQKEQQDIDKLMLDIIRKRVKVFNPVRRVRLLSIAINAAYLCGQQNLQVVGGALKPIPSKFPQHTKVIANKILPAVVNDIAVSTKTNPQFDIIPAGTDEDDKATTKACQKILPYLQRINDPHLHRKSVVLWYDLDGVGWRKIYWSPFHKVIGENPLEGEEGNNPNLKPLEPIFQGEVLVEPVPNNELIYDFRIKDLRKLSWIIHNKTITLGEIKQKFGAEIAGRIPKSALHEGGDRKDSFEIQVMGELAAFSNVYASTDTKTDGMLNDDKLVNYYELWHKIDKNMPQGAYVIALGDIEGKVSGENKDGSLVLAVNGPYPKEQYPHQELPFVEAAPLSLDGILATAPPRITQASIRSQIWDTSDAMGSCVLITARDANIDYKKLDNCNANIIEVDGPYVSGIRREPGVPQANGIFAHLMTIRDDLNELFAFHEPSKGKMPPGGPKSAVGLQVLKEGDDTQLSPIVIGMDRADERVVHQMLTLAVANYKERLIQIVGKDNQWTLEKINETELKGKINVIVRTGSSLPMNKIMEQQKITFAWQSGLLGNPQDPTVRQKVLKSMDLGGFDQILQDNAKQINFAQKEFINAEKLILQMPPVEPDAITIKNGQMEFADDLTQGLIQQYLYVPPINEGIDDHYIHIQEHSNSLVDKWFEYMSSPMVYMQVLAWAMRTHLNQHQTVLMQQQMMMMRMENPKLFADEKEAQTESAGTKKK